MKNLKILLAVVIAFCLSAGNVFAQVDDVIKKMKLVVIWDDGTTSENTPWGWEVGGTTEHYSGNSESAPEISLAQLRFYLSSLNWGNGDLTSNGSLDTWNVDENIRDGSDFELDNVRIYRLGNVPSYENMKKELIKINAIIYINAGASVTDENGKVLSASKKMFDVIMEAANDGVGVMFIGSRATLSAKELDLEKTTFPIMGVQKPFRFKGWAPDGTDVLKEFNFLERNDYGKQDGLFPDFERADTVTIYGDYDGAVELRLGERNKSGEVIYTRTASGSEWFADDFIKTFKYKDENGNEQTGTTSILAAYGEVSIFAKAVEIIDVDEYPAEMNFGLHREPDLEVVAKDGKVYIMNRSWNPGLTINGTEVFSAGTELTANGLQGSMNGNYFVVSDDWFVDVDNSENGSQKDKVLVIKSGTRIKQTTGQVNNATNEDGTYIDQFSAGGLKDLRIVLNPNKEIYKEIFKITDDKIKNNNYEIAFKPWSIDGRISADADIWAFNENLWLESFDKITPDTKFDPDIYYSDYLADQMAGRPDGNNNQFMRPPHDRADFDAAYKNRTENELPATNSSNTKYYDDFKGKLFHTISAVQHGRHRLAMIGYQPTYLKDADASRAILLDITKWIGYNKYELPSAIVVCNGDTLSNGSYIKVSDDGKINVVFPGKELTDLMKEKEHNLKAELTYNGNTIYAEKVIQSGLSDDLIIVFGLNGQNDTDESITLGDGETTIKIKAWAEANENSPIVNSEPIEFDINLNNIIARPNVEKGDSTDSNDTLRIDIVTKDKDGENPTDDYKEIQVIIKDKDGNIVKDTTLLPGNDGIPFAELPAGDLEITIIGKKDGYIDAKPDPIVISNNPDNEAPEIVNARYDFGQYTDGGKTRKPDTLIITFDEPVFYDENETRIFWLYDKEGNNPVEVKVKPIKTDRRHNGKDVWVFEVVETLAREPQDKDLININIKSEMHDKYDNYVDEDNPKQILEVGKKPVNVTVVIIPGKDIADIIAGGGNITTDSKNPIINDVINNGNGSLIIVDPGFSITTDGNDIERIQGIILDAVGNKVAETDEKGNSEQLNTVISQIGGKNVLTIAWNNKNSAGRDVGAGSYILLVESKWKGNEETSRIQKVIPVSAKK